MIRFRNILCKLLTLFVAACTGESQQEVDRLRVMEHSQRPRSTSSAGIEIQLTDWPGTENAPRFSPDGNWLAFDANVDGNTDVYVMNLKTRETRRLTNSPVAEDRPDWSPDGTRLAYRSTQDGVQSLHVLNLKSGADRVIFRADGFQIGGPNWSPDGSRFAITKLSQEGDFVLWGRATILIIDADGGNSIEVTSKGDEWWPRWDAGSAWLYYYVGVTDDIEAVHSRTREIRKISNGEYVGWLPAPSPDEKSLLFVSAMETWSLWLTPMDKAHPPVRLTRAGRDDMPSFSPDGSRVAFSSDRTLSEVVILDLASGERSRIAANGVQPQELPDGRIAYLAPNDGTMDIIVVDPANNERSVITADAPVVVDLSLSPNGDRIAIVASGKLDGRYHVRILDSDGRDTGFAVLDLGKSESPTWCGNETVLVSARESWREGFREVWAVDVTSGTVTRITHSNVSKRPTDCYDDATRIAYRLTGGKSGIRWLEKRTNGYEEVAAFSGHAGRWSPDGTRFAYVDNKKGRTDIFIREANGAIIGVTDDALVEDTPRWSRDGKTLLFSVASPNRDIWMLTLGDLR